MSPATDHVRGSFPFGQLDPHPWVRHFQKAFAVSLSLTALGSASLLSSCTHASPDSTTSVPLEIPNDRAYHEALEKWTRHAHVYSQLQSRIDVWATLLTTDMQDALRVRWKTIHGSENFRLEGAHEGKWGVLLSLHTPDAPWMNLDDRQLWTLAGSFSSGASGGPFLQAESIRRISNTSPFEAFFPYLNRWSQVYLLTFQRDAAPNLDGRPPESKSPSVTPSLPNQFTLSMRSAEAAVAFVWR